MSIVLDAGVSLTIFIIALLFGLQLLIESLRSSEQDGRVLGYATLMLLFFAIAYLTVGLRSLFMIPNATAIMIQGWAVQWGFYLGIAAFFEVFWILRIYNKQYFSGRAQFGALIPFIGFCGFVVLLWLAALTDSLVAIHGWVTWITPNLTTYYGLGFTVITIIYAVCYMCLVPLVSFMLYMRTRRELGSKVFFKDLAMWLGLLIIFITVLADFVLLFLPIATIEVIVVRIMMIVGLILLWFGYRLGNLFLK